MSVAATEERVQLNTSQNYVSWGAVLAAAAIAAAISFVLFSFGSAVGLSMTPVEPSWRAPSALLAALSGLWILVITIGALAAGGYIVGRLRSTWQVAHTDEVEFRDGVHGLVVWALAVSIGALLSVFVAMALVGGAALKSNVDARPGGAVAYALDRLLEPATPSRLAAPEIRDEAGRLLTAAVTAPNFDAREQERLNQLVQVSTGLTPEAARARVDQSIASARATAEAARHAAIILAFITAASLVAGAAAAWEAARIGGRHRDSAQAPSLAWRRRDRTSLPA